MKKTYEYIIIAVNLEVDLHILCTETETIEWIKKELGSKVGNLLRGNDLELLYSHMNYKQWLHGWSLVQKLCHEGWEPINSSFFSVEQHGNPLNAGLVIHQLRKETAVDDKQ